MTKFSSRPKYERKSVKKRRNEKYNFFHLNDSENSSSYDEENGIRVASKQQYLRLKKKNFIETHCQKKKTSKQRGFNQIKIPSQNSILKEIHNITPKSTETVVNDFSDTASLFNFHFQPNWSDFEDNDDIKFVSEDEFDLNNVLQLLDYHQTFEYDESNYPFGYPNKCFNNWTPELCDERYDQTAILANNLEKVIRNNYQSVFELDHDVVFWADIHKEINNLLIISESNKFLLQDILLKDYSNSIQEKCFKWSDMASKCAKMKSCVEIIKDSEIVKSNFQIAIEIFYDQCFSLIEHGVSYPDPLVVRIIDGIKKISKALQNQYNKIERLLNELFEDYEKCNILILEQLDEEINSMEKLSFANGQLSNQLESIVEILRKYLGREKKRMSKQEPVTKSCHFGMETSNSFIGVLKQTYNIDHFLTKFPLKIVIVILVSFMCLFGNLELEQIEPTATVFNRSLFSLSTKIFSSINLNDTFCIL